MSALDEIEKLHKLYISGHLTLEEFEKGKKKILSQDDQNKPKIQNQEFKISAILESLYEKFKESSPETKKKIYLIGGFFVILSLISNIVEENQRENIKPDIQDSLPEINEISVSNGIKKTKCEKNQILLNDLCWEKSVQTRNFDSAKTWCSNKGMRLPTSEELVTSSKQKPIMYPDNLAYYSDNSDVVDMTLGFVNNGDPSDAYNVRCVTELGYETNDSTLTQEIFQGEKKENLGFQANNLGGSSGQMKYLSNLLNKYPKIAIFSITYELATGTKQIIYSRFDKTLKRISYDNNSPVTTEEWSRISDSDINKSAILGEYPNNGTYNLSR
jgi:hypothetical protein